MEQKEFEKNSYIAAYIQRARVAQGQYEHLSQEEVDEAVMTVAKTVHDNADFLANMAVEETGMGNASDKTEKNKNKAKIIWNSLKGKKSRGILGTDERTGITKVAKPIGVVAAITPMTNPIVTPMSNIMFALKSGNAIIISPHHKAVNSSGKTVELINAALGKLGLPEDLVQILDRQSRENTSALMASADIVVATGGMGMVKAAYSSGRPALGVGAGNVQCIIDDDADIADTVPKIVAGRAFDNGIICSAEQAVICPEEKYEAILDEFSNSGALVLRDPAERNAVRDAIFDHGMPNKLAIGQSVQAIGKLAGIDVPDGIRVIVVEAEGTGEVDILGKEKMCPVIAAYKSKSFEESVEIARRNLEAEGKGHSVSIHSNSQEHIEYAGETLSASRFLINQTCAGTAGGSFFNGLSPTNTLGCGSWGHNSISENLTYTHLMNVSRIAYFMPHNHVPEPDELWTI